jgi:hypothetical protein
MGLLKEEKILYDGFFKAPNLYLRIRKVSRNFEGTYPFNLRGGKIP